MKNWKIAVTVMFTSLSGDDSSNAPMEVPAPQGAATSALANGNIELTWTDVATSETSYQIHRRAGTTGEFQQIATIGANTARFVDNVVNATVQYCYRVRAASP